MVTRGLVIAATLPRSSQVRRFSSCNGPSLDIFAGGLGGLGNMFSSFCRRRLCVVVIAVAVAFVRATTACVRALPVAINAGIFFFSFLIFICLMVISCHQIKLKEVLREHFARHAAGGKSTRAIVFTQFRDSVEVRVLYFCCCRFRYQYRCCFRYPLPLSLSLPLPVPGTVLFPLPLPVTGCVGATTTVDATVTVSVAVYCGRCCHHSRYHVTVLFPLRLPLPSPSHR